MGMKFLGEGPTRLLPPPSSSSSPRRGFDLESAELWVDPDDGSTQGDDPVEGVRTAMLRHQHVFRSQLFELHRLYWTQKSLMNNRFPYDHQPANHNPAAFHWPAAAADQMPMPSVAAKPKVTAITTQDRSSISSHQPQLNFVPGWNVDDGPLPPLPPHVFNSKLPQQEWLTASEFQLFHDYHTARDPETRCFQQQPPNSSAAWSAVAVKPEPVDLTLCTAPYGSSNHDVDKRTFWGRFPIGKLQPSLITGPKEVINLDSSSSSSSSDSDEVNRDECEEAAARPTAASCFTTPPPVCGSEPGRQERRLPKPFDMNHMFEEQQGGVDHYGTGHSVNVQPGLTETNDGKPEKTVLFDLNTIQYEDSHAVISEVENNVSSSSAGSSSVVVQGVANDGCASLTDFRLGFGNMRSEECAIKREVEKTVKGDPRNLENKRSKVTSNESDNVRSSRVTGSSSVWNSDGSDDANPMAPRVPASKFLLELNSLPDDDDEDEIPVPCSNGPSSLSQSKLQCLSSRCPSNLVDPSSDSRVASSVTDCLPGGSHQPSLESTNLPSAVGGDMGTIAKGVEGERSEEDTVSSRMHRSSNSFQHDRSNCSLEQKQGGEFEACAFRNEPQCNSGMLINLFGREDEALIGDIDGQAVQQRLNCAVGNAGSPSVDAQQHAVAGVGGSVSLVNNPRSCYNELHRRDGDNNIHSKQQDMGKDVMILTAAETLAHIFNTQGVSCTSGFPDAVVRPQEVGEEMEWEAQPECSYDSLELIVLALPESQEDECSSPANNSNRLTVETATTTENSSGLRFNTRRGRQLRDFQKDILPGIVSLSRHEICEDMHAFTEIVKFEELKRKGGRLGRWGTSRGSRGSFVRKKRTRTSAYVQRR